MLSYKDFAALGVGDAVECGAVLSAAVEPLVLTVDDIAQGDGTLTVMFTASFYDVPAGSLVAEMIGEKKIVWGDLT